MQIIHITHWTLQCLTRLDSHMRHIASAMSFTWYVFEAPVLILPASRFLYRFDYSFLFFPYLVFVSPSHIRMFSGILQSLRTDHYLLLTFLFATSPCDVTALLVSVCLSVTKEDRLTNAFLQDSNLLHRLIIYMKTIVNMWEKMPPRCNICFLLQILLLAQHVSGTIMPIIRSSRVLCSWLLPVVFGALVLKLSVWCGARKPDA